MNYRYVGRAGINISEIGFGAWGIGGPSGDMDAYGLVDDKDSLCALHTAIEEGINFFDTSPLYGYGKSEELIGKAIRGIRNDVLIATKVGYIDGNRTQNFTADHIFKSVEGSLRKIKTDYVDFIQLHDPPLEEMSDEIFSALRKLVEKGKVRFIGVSAKSPDDALRYVKKYDDISLIQANLSIVDQRGINNGLIDECFSKGIAFVARTPFSFGLFLDDSQEKQFPDGDHRRKWSKEQ